MSDLDQAVAAAVRKARQRVDLGERSLDSPHRPDAPILDDADPGVGVGRIDLHHHAPDASAYQRLGELFDQSWMAVAGQSDPRAAEFDRVEGVEELLLF